MSDRLPQGWPTAPVGEVIEDSRRDLHPAQGTSMAADQIETRFTQVDKLTPSVLAFALRVAI